jgi:hypothetical protein
MTVGLHLVPLGQLTLADIVGLHLTQPLYIGFEFEFQLNSLSNLC